MTRPTTSSRSPPCFKAMAHITRICGAEHRHSDKPSLSILARASLPFRVSDATTAACRPITLMICFAWRSQPPTSSLRAMNACVETVVDRRSVKLVCPIKKVLAGVPLKSRTTAMSVDSIKSPWTKMAAMATMITLKTI